MSGVLVAVGNRWDSQVATVLESSRQVRIARRCADLADLIAAAESRTGDVALVSVELRGLALSVVSRLRESGLAVVGLTDPADEDCERRLRQMGVVWTVAADGDLAAYESALMPPQAGSAAEAASSVAGTPPLPEPRQSEVSPARGTLVAVWGPVGSPGRTTIAVNLAAELAALGTSALLVDADTYGGCVAQTLAVLDEAPGLAAATRAADHGTLDLPALARLAPEVVPRLRVLTGIPRSERWTEIRAGALERVMELSRSLAEVVVVDCGFSLEDDEELSYDTEAPRRNQATLTSLQVADTLLAVGGCDPVSLQRLVRGLQDLGTVRAPRPSVVVNRVRPGAVGAQPQVRVADAMARFAGIEDLAFVPEDRAACDDALLSGRTLAECAPQSPCRVAIRGLAQAVAGKSPATTGRTAARTWGAVRWRPTVAR
ncbi:MAG: AAA family ATPase [Dermatophilaceae bacterium]